MLISLNTFQDAEASGWAKERRNRLEAYNFKESRLNDDTFQSANFQFLQDSFSSFGALAENVWLSGGSVIHLLETGCVAQDSDLDFVLFSKHENCEEYLASLGFSKVSEHPADCLYRLKKSEQKIDLWLSKTSMQQDARNRDFTVCALYMNQNGDIKDPTKRGIRDLQDNLLETVAPDWDSAYDRLCADPSKRLRLIKYVITRHFQIGRLLKNAIARPWDLSEDKRGLILKKITHLVAINENYQQENISSYNRLALAMEAAGFLERIFPKWENFSTKFSNDDGIQAPLGARNELVRRYYQTEFGSESEAKNEEEEITKIAEYKDEKQELPIVTVSGIFANPKKNRPPKKNISKNTPAPPVKLSSVPGFLILARLVSSLPQISANNTGTLTNLLKKYNLGIHEILDNDSVFLNSNPKEKEHISKAILKEMHKLHGSPLKMIMQSALSKEVGLFESDSIIQQCIDEFFQCVHACGDPKTGVSDKMLGAVIEQLRTIAKEEYLAEYKESSENQQAIDKLDLESMHHFGLTVKNLSREKFLAGQFLELSQDLNKSQKQKAEWVKRFNMLTSALGENFHAANIEVKLEDSHEKLREITGIADGSVEQYVRWGGNLDQHIKQLQLWLANLETTKIEIIEQYTQILAKSTLRCSEWLSYYLPFCFSKLAQKHGLTCIHPVIDVLDENESKAFPEITSTSPEENALIHEMRELCFDSHDIMQSYCYYNADVPRQSFIMNRNRERSLEEWMQLLSETFRQDFTDIERSVRRAHASVIAELDQIKFRIPRIKLQIPVLHEYFTQRQAYEELDEAEFYEKKMLLEKRFQNVIELLQTYHQTANKPTSSSERFLRHYGQLMGYSQTLFTQSGRIMSYEEFTARSIVSQIAAKSCQIS